ncbi:cobalt ECF transporter T component CbiQ [uncultured Rhodoblastus sp.]|uniref:cobalt ECF transporter T component CbiQ n=1 Tax=uncultured Rhodoblastus sp. TaxID=543037 RepID=UPI0025F7C62F|nr:cobalt ECF transporter T component CbiQ [uncultured Rhodoblastus sp.]
MSPVDRAAHLNRWRHRSLTEKAALALGMMLLAIALPPGPGAPMVAAIMTAAALAGARVAPKVWLACALAPLGFLAVGAISLAVQLDSHGLSLAPGGLAAAARLVLRSFAALTCLLFLALTTPAADLIAGLRRLGLPAEIAELALLIYRFLFLLGDTAMAMDAAQAARLGHAGAKRRLRALGLLIANLLPRALDRARRLETGLAARGWDGELRVLSHRAPVSLPAMGLIGLTLFATAAAGIRFS